MPDEGMWLLQEYELTKNNKYGNSKNQIPPIVGGRQRRNALLSDYIRLYITG